MERPRQNAVFLRRNSDGHLHRCRDCRHIPRIAGAQLPRESRLRFGQAARRLSGLQPHGDDPPACLVLRHLAPASFIASIAGPSSSAPASRECRSIDYRTMFKAAQIVSPETASGEGVVGRLLVQVPHAGSRSPLPRPSSTVWF